MMFTGRTILAILLVMAASTAAEASGKPRHRPRRRKHAAAPATAPAPPRAPVKANVHPFYAGVDAEPVGTMHLLYTGLLDHSAPGAGLESVNATPDGIFWTEGNSLPSISFLFAKTGERGTLGTAGMVAAGFTVDRRNRVWIPLRDDLQVFDLDKTLLVNKPSVSTLDLGGMAARVLGGAPHRMLPGPGGSVWALYPSEPAWTRSWGSGSPTRRLAGWWRYSRTAPGKPSPSRQVAVPETFFPPRTAGSCSRWRANPCLVPSKWPRPRGPEASLLRRPPRQPRQKARGGKSNPIRPDPT